MIVATRCWYRKCGAHTRNPTGLCVEHAHMIDRACTAQPPANSQLVFLSEDKFRRKPKYGREG